jgi:hypothetical protein
MPLDVIGEHAQRDVSTHARRRPMEDRSNVQTDGLDAANSPFHLGETLVGPHGGAVVDGRGFKVGADHEMPSRRASASIASCLRANEKSAPVMVSVKCLERETAAAVRWGADAGRPQCRNVGRAWWLEGRYGSEIVLQNVCS